MKETEQMPDIKILDYIENKDGSATLKFETNKAFDKMYLEQTGKKRVTKKGLANYVLELIEKSVNKLDGYDIKKQDKSTSI